MNDQRNLDPRNLIVMVALVVFIVFGWPAVVDHFWPNAHKHQPKASTASAGSVAGPAASDPAAGGKPTREGGLLSATDQAVEAQDLKSALAAPSRVAIVAPGLSGSINLAGGVIDDLSLNRHKATLEKDSAAVRLFSPAGTPAQQFAQVGWAGSGAAPGMLPDGNTVWTAPAGAKLTPASPVTLNWTNAGGQSFALTYAIDQDYMITVTQTVANHGAAPVSLQPFAFVNRTDRTASVDSWNIHSGPFGAFDGKVSFSPGYKDVVKSGEVSNDGRTDWLGFTDIYWMSALIPDGTGATSVFRALGGGIYRADLMYKPAIVAPGDQLAHTTRLFAGAKESQVLDRYERGGIRNFGYAVDWGWFWFFEKPIFALLRAIFHATGNFGVAIILLTIIVRGIMFPVAQRQFASMAAMRALQPKMKALQERHKDDKQKLQEETMKLYKEEKVNPLAGCLPVFLQIPVFFALYKVLMVSIEMRHQPFALWIKDLSVPDPYNLVTLAAHVGIPLPAFLGLSLLALLLGITMYFQFKLQPANPDPAQQQVMGIMPWMMMFIMAPFAAGLLIYWITSNCLTMAQQAYLYSKHPALKAQAAKDAVDGKRAAARRNG